MQLTHAIKVVRLLGEHIVDSAVVVVVVDVVVDVNSNADVKGSVVVVVETNVTIAVKPSAFTLLSEFQVTYIMLSVDNCTAGKVVPDARISRADSLLLPSYTVTKS